MSKNITVIDMNDLLNLEKKREEVLDTISQKLNASKNPYDLSDAEITYWTVRDLKSIVESAENEEVINLAFKIFKRIEHKLR